MTKDVELVVRARIEAQKAVDTFTASLKELVGATDNVKGSAGEAGGVIGSLGQEIAGLSKEVNSLRDFSKVVSGLDQAAQAVDRLETRVANTRGELQRLSQAQADSARSTAQARDASQSAAQAYDQERAKLATVRAESGRASEAYQQQAAAVAAAKEARAQANAVLRNAQTEETKLGKALVATAGQLDLQEQGLKIAREGWEALYATSLAGSEALGGVAASQAEVATAADTAATKLRLAKGALDFHQEAAAAKDLREAADYVKFWTQALNEKDAAERRDADAAGAQLYADAKQQAKAATQAEEDYQSALNARLGIQGRATVSAKDSFTAFAEAGRTEDQMSAAVARLRAQIEPAAVAQEQLNAQISQARDLYKAGYINIGQLAAAERVLAENAKKSAAGGGVGGGLFLGLRPYELHSLSYQINDVITQFASGARPMQILAQQGGQVFQVFQRQLVPVLEKVGPAILASAPEIAIALAGLTTVGVALKNIGDRAESVHQFAGELTASADGAIYNAKALAETAHQLDVFGGSLGDARSELKAFLKDGINPGNLQAFGQAAQNFAYVFGKKIPDAAAQMATAFSGGYEQIKKLDDEFNFLSAAERKHIKDMIDSGHAAEARTLAFQIFSQRQEEAARNMRGPWSTAVHNLAAAWDNFLGFLEHSGPIEFIVEKLGQLAKLAKEVSEHLPGASERAADVKTAAAEGTTPEIAAMERELAALKQARTDAAAREAAHPQGGLLTGKKGYNLRAPGGGLPADLQSTVALDQQILDLEAKIEAARKAAIDTVNADSQARQKARQEQLDAIGRERKSLGDITDQQKIRLAGEKAYQDAIRDTGDVALATARKQLAMDQEIDRQRKAINYGRLTTKIVGAETAGQANPATAANGASTALGLGQFVEDTWLKLFKKYFPAEAAGKTEQQILDLRKDADLSKKMIEIYARQNADVLQKAGLAVNEAALYLAHFLGPDGAVKVLKAALTSPNTPVGKLLSPKAIQSNKRILAGKTAGQVVDYADSVVGNSDAARASIDIESQAADLILKNLRERQKAQDDLNLSLDQEAQKRNRAADDAAKTNGLTYEALILQERDNYIKDAVAAAQEKVAKASQKEVEAGRDALAFDEKRKKAIEDAAAAEFDAQHQAALLAAERKKTEDGVNDVMAQRQALLEQIGLAQQTGQVDLARQLINQFDGLNSTLDEAIQKAIDFWNAIAGDPTKMGELGLTAREIQTIVTGLKNAGLQAKVLGTNAIASGKEINQWFGQNGAKAVDTFAQSAAATGKVFVAARDAFLQFAADFLRYIAEMIVKTEFLNLVGAGSGGGGGLGGAISSFVGSLFGGGGGGSVNFLTGGKYHTGGIAGQGSARMLPATWFANARRMHTGGIVGLAPDEYPTVLQKNEEVLTQSNPRHIFNAGSGGTETDPTDRWRIVNLFDSADVFAKGLTTRVGERALINFVRTNAQAIGQAMGLKS